MAQRHQALRGLLWVVVLVSTIPGCSCENMSRTKTAEKQHSNEENRKSAERNSQNETAPDESLDTVARAASEERKSGKPVSPSAGSTSNSNVTDGSRMPRTSESSSASRQSSHLPDDSGTPTLSPAECLRQAGELRREAESLAESEPGEAYAKALRGWQIVSQHAKDAGCQKLRADLEALMGPLGKRANQRAGVGSPVHRRNQSTAIQ